MYACVVWCPHTIKDINLLEAVQRRAARWACNNRWDPVTFTWSVSSEDCYRRLCLPPLCVRRDYLSVCTLQDIRHTNTISFPTYCTYNIMPTRSHVLTLIPPSSTINARRHSFFVRVCFIRNAVPINILNLDVSPRCLQTFLLTFFVCVLFCFLCYGCIVFCICFVCCIVVGQCLAFCTVPSLW